MKTILFVTMLLAPAIASADQALDKSGAWDCAKDPVAHIGNGKLKITFKGKCTSISIGSGKNTITIEEVDTLEVGGGENTITVGTVGTIDVGGAKNKITWKKAASGDKPTIKGNTPNNTISQAK